MNRAARHPLGWAPVFVVGIASAVAAEVAMALLLYSGPGFNRSLTTLLTVEALALSAGLRFPVGTPEVVDGLRRRWLLALLAFLAATVFGTVWTLVPELGSGRVAQGVGLALLAGLPLYACGALLVGLARESREAEAAERDGVGAVAALGAALGFALTGLLLPRAPTPSSLLVGCLVFLSLGGLAYAAVRASRPSRRVVAEGCVGPPPVRVEEYVPAGSPWTDWLLLEGRTTRASRRVHRDDGEGAGEADAVDWDVRVLRELAPVTHRPWRALFLGGGASRAPTECERLGAAEVVVLERAHCVVDLGRSHFDTGLVGDPGPDEPSASSRPRVVVGNLEDAIHDLRGAFDLVFVDGRVLEPVGGSVALSHRARHELLDMLAPDGALVWGPKAAHHPRPVGDAGWVSSRHDRGEPLEEVLVVRRRTDARPAATAADGGSAGPP